MELIDSHCHLQFGKYFPEPGRVINQAAEKGVLQLICVGTTLGDSREAATMAAKFDKVWATAGIHPHGAELFSGDFPAELLSILELPRVVAVGEIGLDYYRMRSDKESQKRALRQQLEVAVTKNLPVVFHIRDAWQDVWPIIDSYPGLNGVIHSFSAGMGELEQIVSRGFLVGLNGIMTFTKDQEQLEAAEAVPLGRLIIETDAPFLTPKPFRGDVCEPKHVVNVAEFLANLRGENLEVLAKATTSNSKKLFGI